MRVLFVCGADFSGPSEKQALGFAEQLLRRGHAVAIAIRGSESPGVDTAALSALEVVPYRFRGRRLVPQARQRMLGFAPDVVHAFNPRLVVLTAASEVVSASGAALVVHFEDDEWSLIRASGLPVARRVLRRPALWLSRWRVELWPFATRASLARAAAEAAALDALTPALSQEVQARLGRRAEVVLPVLPTLPGLGEQPRRPHAADGERTILYTGNVFGAHLSDFRILLRAVAVLRRRGIAVRLVHAGTFAPRLDPGRLAAQEGLRTDDVHLLGQLPLTEMPALLRRADVLVQPGAPSEFNRLRLPSKLQSYLASGTPTVTFAVGFGELLVDGEEALLTRTADPEELSDQLMRVLTDPDLATRLGEGGRRAARRLFDPVKNATTLIALYESALSGPASGRVR